MLFQFHDNQNDLDFENKMIHLMFFLYTIQYYPTKLTHHLIKLGEIVLEKENTKNESYCSYQNEYNDKFDYHGIENALCGKTEDNNPFTPKRILVIQMK